ncbi:Fic/DOC family protein [Devosia ginsengisoli]
MLRWHDRTENRAGLTDQDELNEFEFAMYLSRAEEPLPTGDLGYEHYRRIHHHLFQDVYDWAGQRRSVRIGKGGNWFCYPEHLSREMHRAFSLVDPVLTSATAQNFAERAAILLAGINAGHPFREGNGRTQLAYLALLAATIGYGFNQDMLDPDRVISAMIASFSGELLPLTQLISDLIRNPG